MPTGLLIATLLALPTLGAPAAPVPHALRDHPEPGHFEVVSDTEIYADGVRYHSWPDLAASGYFRQHDTRCGTLPDHDAPDPVLARGGANDCSMSNTNPDAAYDPSLSTLRIAVVVHVIQRTNGTGFISEDRVRSQIDILNEDFLALTGTNGALGFDARIEFYLATEDPDGNPTTGITYSTNNTWYNDGGGYWNSLAWDPNRYMNIYTNSAEGYLGYVPAYPQEGIVGQASDRVVILDASFGRDAPLEPYNLGRTATHEVGHYLGLFHTFDGGCGTVTNCAHNGDLICDTNPESGPTWGCPGARTSCSLPAPFDNYMDYTDDACMTRFTPDQAFRMRCTLMNYRPDLYTIDNPAEPCPADFAEPFGVIDFTDVLAFINLFNTADNAADTNLDGVVNFFDVTTFLAAFGDGCP